VKRRISRIFTRHAHRLWAAGIICFSLLFVLSGCATTKKHTGEQGAYEEIPFSEILTSPDKYKGETVRLGGVIINTENRERESVLEILEQPLNRQGRPKSGDVSGGRFLVVFQEFLDGAIYRPNRPVTIIGEIVGMKTAPIGEATYEYPLLAGREIRLWEARSYFDRPRMHFGIGIGGSSGGVSVGTSF